MSATTATTAAPGKILPVRPAYTLTTPAMLFCKIASNSLGFRLSRCRETRPCFFSRQKFEACVIRLYDPQAEQILKIARNSPSNRRMVIYGIARNTQESLRYSSYGINAVMNEPLDRQSVLKVVRATHLLVIHELRRYVRVPVMTEADIDTGSGHQHAVTLEVSSGGMSVRCPGPLPASDRQSFRHLPRHGKVSSRAYVCGPGPRRRYTGCVSILPTSVGSKYGAGSTNTWKSCNLKLLPTYHLWKRVFFKCTP